MSSDVDSDRVDLVRRKAEAWADQLIDFGPRNALLHYRDSKTTTLDLTGADPESMAHLFSGRKTRLSALFAEGEAHAAACGRARNLRRRMLDFQEEQGIDVGRLASGLFCMQPSTTRGTTPVRPLRAPLILRSLALTPRTAAETDYVVELIGEPEVNPVLLYSLNRQHGVDVDVARTAEQLNARLEDLDDANAQVEAVYNALTTALARQGRTAELEQRTVAGTFVFEKLPMVNDLKTSAKLLAAHDVIAAAAGYEPAKATLRAYSDGYVPTKPDKISPRDEYLVIEADSSQQQSINAVLDGRHVVIQGPPGTGKSQTIANIIAAASALGKRILFVAEKRAAIEAVTERLERVDLGHLVFDLHQRKFNKREVAKQVTESLERASKELPPQVNGLHDRLADRRARAIHHKEVMRDPREPWAVSPFQVYQRLLELPDGSRNSVRFHGSNLRTLHGDIVRSVEDDLANFVNSDGLRFRRGDSAWSRSDIREADQAGRILIELDTLSAKTWPQAQEDMRGLISRAGFRRPTDLPGWQNVLSLLRDVELTLARYQPEVFGAELDDFCFAASDRHWRSAHPRKLGWWRRWGLRRRAGAIRTAGRSGRRTLYAELLAAVRQRDRWLELAADGGTPKEVVGLSDVVTQVAKARDQLAAVAMGARLEEPDRWSEDVVTATVGHLRDERDFLFRVPHLNNLTDRLETIGLGRLLDELVERDAGPDQARDMFSYSWYSSLLDEYRLRLPHLGQFSGRQHGHIVAEFQQFDAEHFQLNAQRVRRKLAERLRAVRDAHPDQNEVVRGEAKRKRGHMPLRRFVARAPDVLLAARPCWAMSPIVVSRLLPARRLFDLVIFDEASQVEPYDAMASIMRGSQLVVAGDERQLPPNTFFRTALNELDQDDDEDDVIGAPNAGDFESILSCLATFVPQTYLLQWHYRSQDERLIAFSNQEIYDHQLITFPGCRAESPLALHVVDGRVAPGQDGSPAEEAEKVVELAVEHARKYPDDTLGVITMGDQHARRIEAALRRAGERHEELAEFVARMEGPGRRLFVKSIERVQGDERDAIIFSIGAAKGPDGRLRMTAFGPLNRQGGERRLNVAVTRARRRMTVIASFSPYDMKVTGLSVGSELLRQFLTFAENGGDLTRIGSHVPAELNGFERSVRDAIKGAGIEVTPQWGVSGYRIDFALAHRDQPGRMVLAVEADGDTYHKLESARDRDRLRQEHLERLGWRFHRLWASDWFNDQEGQTTLIAQRWEEAMADTDRELARTAAVDEPPVQSAAVTADRGPRPAFLSLPRRSKIDDYIERELVELCRWLLRDRLPLDREARIGQAIDVLGFLRRTNKMKERIGAALVRAQRLAEQEGM